MTEANPNSLPTQMLALGSDKNGEPFTNRLRVAPMQDEERGNEDDILLVGVLELLREDIASSNASTISSR